MRRMCALPAPLRAPTDARGKITTQIPPIWTHQKKKNYMHPDRFQNLSDAITSAICFRNRNFQEMRMVSAPKWSKNGPRCVSRQFVTLYYIAVIFFKSTIRLSEIRICLHAPFCERGVWKVRFVARRFILRVSVCAQSICGMFLANRNVQGHRKSPSGRCVSSF